MSDNPSSDSPSKNDNGWNPVNAVKREFDTKTNLYAGISLVYVSIAAIFSLFIFSSSIIGPFYSVLVLKDATIEIIVAAALIPAFIVIFCVLCLALGYRLISSSGVTTDFVLPAQDKDLLTRLITEGNEQGVRLYLDLSSIKGTTGTFTKLGITGLPLATIFLTCFFSAAAYLSTTFAENKEIGETFLDLAKLTLGAFIGSFVQRQSDRLSDRRVKQDLGTDPIPPTVTPSSAAPPPQKP